MFVARNSKNVDRFFKPFLARLEESTTTTDFPAIIGTGPSDPVDVSGSPMATWALQVTGDGAAATAWTVLLEGSTDGVAYTEILKHTTLIGDGVNIWSGTTLFLAKYYRVNVTALTLGAATGITASVIGKQ